MSALTPRRWYASQRHARLDVDGPKVVLYDSWERNALGHMRSVWRLACWTRAGNTVENAMPTPIVVTGRTMAHVDRLARDFLAHGVSPTKTGGRGVPSWSTRKPCDCDLSVRVRHAYRRMMGLRSGLLSPREAGPSLFPKHRPECVSFAFARAESRARRVVSR